MYVRNLNCVIYLTRVLTAHKLDTKWSYTNLTRDGFTKTAIRWWIRLGIKINICDVIQIA
jgi:hypothetical protein